MTTSPGIEDLLEQELRDIFGKEYLSSDIRVGKGRVVARLREVSRLWEKTRLLTLAHRVGLLVSKAIIRTNINGLNDIKSNIISSPIAEYVTPNTTFAIRAERAGIGHEYTSIDIARKAGEAVIEAVKAKYGLPPKVELDYPQLVVHVDVIEKEMYMYISLTGDLSLHRRGYRIYDHPAALKPTIAKAMILLSGIRDKEILLDPMCGGGTIPIEAALTFENTTNICMDINSRHLNGARMNAIAAGVISKIKFVLGDTRNIGRSVSEIVDHIITNPPYGIRLGNPRAIRKLYKDFILSAYKTLRYGGKLTIITPEYDYVDAVIEAASMTLRKIHERKVAHGGLYPRIIVYEKE